MKAMLNASRTFWVTEGLRLWYVGKLGKFIQFPAEIFCNWPRWMLFVADLDAVMSLRILWVLDNWFFTFFLRLCVRMISSCYSKVLWCPALSQEAVNINQSLFVLRRVITALSRNADEYLWRTVDRWPSLQKTLTIAKVRHVPYRESKLSLGANGNWEMDLEYPTNSCFLIIYL